MAQTPIKAIRAKCLDCCCDQAKEVRLGDMKMMEIDTYTIKKYMSDLQTNGQNEKNGKPLAHKTVLKHYIVLHAFFENAVEDEIIPYSPM